MNSKTKRKNHFALIASISFVLLAAILGSLYYKYQIAEKENNEELLKEEVIEQEDTTSDRVTEEQLNEEQPTDSPSEKEVETDLNEPTSTKPSENKVEKPIAEIPIPSPAEKEAKVEIENGYIVGQKPATEPTYINGILIANKKNPLPSTYNKGEDTVAKAAYEKMAAAAKEQGFELVAFSGFRSYDYQQTLYDRYVSRDGKEAADRYSARPGHSEHQTGLAFDIGEKGREDLWLTSAFGETPAGQWLANNAHEYGFILRYPKGKEEITGFMYESWHFRYLEGDTAKKIYEQGVTLEEYLGIE